MPKCGDFLGSSASRLKLRNGLTTGVCAGVCMSLTQRHGRNRHIVGGQHIQGFHHLRSTGRTDVEDDHGRLASGLGQPERCGNCGKVEGRGSAGNNHHVGLRHNLDPRAHLRRILRFRPVIEAECGRNSIFAAFPTENDHKIRSFLSTICVDQDGRLFPQALFVVYKLLSDKKLFRTAGFGLNAPAGPFCIKAKRSHPALPGLVTTCVGG